MNISVIGSGTWGTALALVAHRNNHNVKMWSYKEEGARIVNEEHICKNLPGIVIPSDIICYTSPEEAIRDADIVLIVTPSSAIRETLDKFKPFVKPGQIFVLCSKGIEKGTQMNYSEVIQDVLPEVKVAVLSGPSHAEEVADNIPTAVVIASSDDYTLKTLQVTFMSPTFRVYTSNDTIGVEIGGCVKNIIALSCGVAVGLGYGDNTIAAIVTRGLVEIARLSVALGAEEETVYGLTGLGDLFLTCSSKFSRNRMCGILIGQGKKLDEALQEIGMVVEGINAVETTCILLEKYNINAPIIFTMRDILYNGKSPKDATYELMTRSKKSEF